MATRSKQITIFDPDDRLQGENVVYDVVDRRDDGGIVLVPHHAATPPPPELSVEERLRRLEKVSGAIDSDGELRRTVEALRDEWPS